MDDFLYIYYLFRAHLPTYFPPHRSCFHTICELFLVLSWIISTVLITVFPPHLSSYFHSLYQINSTAFRDSCYSIHAYHVIACILSKLFPSHCPRYSHYTYHAIFFAITKLSPPRNLFRYFRHFGIFTTLSVLFPPRLPCYFCRIYHISTIPI